MEVFSSAKSSTPKCFVLIANFHRGEPGIFWFFALETDFSFSNYWSWAAFVADISALSGPDCHKAGSPLLCTHILLQMWTIANTFVMASQARHEHPAEIATVLLLIFNVNFSSQRRKTFWFRDKSEMIFVLRLSITSSQINVSIWTVVWQLG